MADVKDKKEAKKRKANDEAPKEDNSEKERDKKKKGDKSEAKKDSVKKSEPKKKDKKAAKKRKPKTSKAETNDQGNAQIGDNPEGEEGAEATGVQVVDFPVNQGEVDNDQELTRTATRQDLALLMQIQDAALTNAGYDWPTPEQMKQDMDVLAFRITVKGGITRVALDENEIPIGFYVLMPPIDQADMVLTTDGGTTPASNRPIAEPVPGAESVTGSTAAAEPVEEEEPPWTDVSPPLGPKLLFNSSYISHLFVHPSFQRLGVGSMLVLDAVEQCLKYMPISVHLELNADPTNTAAHAFYRKHGFRVSAVENDHVRFLRPLYQYQRIPEASPPTITSSQTTATPQQPA